MIRDFNIEWLEKSIYIPAQLFQSQITGAFIGDGTPVFAEIAAADVTAPLLASTGTGINHIMRVPYDLDRNHAVRFRVWTSINIADQDVETFTILYSALKAGGTIIDAATALDTVVPAYTFSANINSAEVTSFGAIKRGTLLDTTEFLALKVTLTFNTASNSEVSILGLEMRYTPRRTIGTRRNIVGGKRLDPTRPLGVIWQGTAQEGL
jgi:hypothetical protein